MQLNETESLSSYFLSQNNIRRNKMKWVNEWNDNDILFFKQILYFMMNKYEVLETPIKYLHPPPHPSLSFSLMKLGIRSFFSACKHCKQNHTPYFRGGVRSIACAAAGSTT